MNRALLPIWALVAMMTLMAPMDVLGRMSSGPCGCNTHASAEFDADADEPMSCCALAQTRDKGKSEGETEDEPAQPCSPGDCDCPLGCCTMVKAPVASEVSVDVGFGASIPPAHVALPQSVVARQYHEDIEHPPQA